MKFLRTPAVAASAYWSSALCLLLLHINSTNINNQTKDKVHTDKLPEDIINIGKSSINFGVKGEIPKNNI